MGIRLRRPFVRLKFFLMKSSSLLFWSWLTISVTAMAQPASSGNQSERMEALRIAFVTERLSLTPEESKAFWPMHEAFDAQMESKKEAMRARKEAFDAKTSTDAEFRELVQDLTDEQKALIDLQSQHVIEVADLLGAERALLLSDLKRELAHQVRERLNAPGRNGPRGPRQGQNLKHTRRARRH